MPSAAAALAALAMMVLTQATHAEEAAAGQPAGAPPQATASEASASPPSLPALTWLEGCWQGKVNEREFREVWLPYRGAMMLGVSQTVLADKTIDYEYLRLEARPDGAYYVILTPGKPDLAFKFTEQRMDEQQVMTFVFADPSRDFPNRITYHRAREGWLYTDVEGKVNGADRKVTYPLRRVTCETGEAIRK